MIEIIILILGLAILLSSLYGIFMLARLIYGKMRQNQPEVSKGNSTTMGKIAKNSSGEKNNGLDKTTIRFLVIGLIALLMLIPITQVTGLVAEREGLYYKVLRGIADQWGKPQVISGPALVLPIIEKYVVDEKVKSQDGSEKIISKDVYKNKHLVILPKKLDKDIKMQEHYRHRAIYKSLVYEAAINVQGRFMLPDIKKMSDNLHQVRYEKAFVLMGLSDTKAINHVTKINLGSRQYTFEPGVRRNIGGINSGFHAKVTLEPEIDEYEFNFAFNTKGSSNIRFTAFGETTEVTILSKWQHPSFQGDILPTERKTVNDGFDGFSARWVIPSLARSFPQNWIAENDSYRLDSLKTGVDLYEPVFLYSLVSRAIKYGILFIALTFLTFLIFELTSKNMLHYIQYALIGLSMAMFFLTLLSLSEHIMFLYAYIVAAAITVFSISVYSYFGSRRAGQALVIFVLLSALYIILYSLLQLEDYALLMGTGLLLTVLLVLMWITRNLRAGSSKKLNGN